MNSSCPPFRPTPQGRPLKADSAWGHWPSLLVPLSKMVTLEKLSRFSLLLVSHWQTRGTGTKPSLLGLPGPRLDPNNSRNVPAISQAHP